MGILDILNTLISFGSLVVAIIALCKAKKVEKMIDNSYKTEQKVEGSTLKDSDVIQVGGNYKGEK